MKHRNILEATADLIDDYQQLKIEYLPLVVEALKGPIIINGEPQYLCVCMYCVHQLNVDSEECLDFRKELPSSKDEDFFPLCLLSDKEQILPYYEFWKEYDYKAWIACVWRILEPLSLKLKQRNLLDFTPAHSSNLGLF